MYLEVGTVDGTGSRSALMPNNTFPFSRLASVTSKDGSASYLYHQMNGTTLAEEQFDKSLNLWLPTVYITVSDS